VGLYNGDTRNVGGHNCRCQSRQAAQCLRLTSAASTLQAEQPRNSEVRTSRFSLSDWLGLIVVNTNLMLASKDKPRS